MRQANTVVEKGTPELVAKMDAGQVSISAAVPPGDHGGRHHVRMHADDAAPHPF